MSTLNVDTINDRVGTGQPAISGLAKAWVNFDGTFGTSPFTVANGGIRAAYNVASVTDNAAGDYTVNFTTAMPDANYSYTFGSSKTSGQASGGVVTYIEGTTYSTTQIRLQNSSSNIGGARDNENINVAFFR